MLHNETYTFAFELQNLIFLLKTEIILKSEQTRLFEISCSKSQQNRGQFFSFIQIQNSSKCDNLSLISLE